MALGRCIWEGWTLESGALTRDLGSWLLLCTCVCWGISAPEGAGEPSLGSPRSLPPGPRAGTFTCLTNNILRIDCHWSAPELGHGSGPWLLFTSNQAPGGKHRCTFQGSQCTVLLPPEEVLLPTDNFTITLHRCVLGEEQVSLVDSQYLPRRHVKLDPPSDLHSNISSGYCVLTWSISPDLEPMIPLLSYELAFKKQEEAWEQARLKDHITGVTWIILEVIELDPGSTYEARLRTQMATLEGGVEEEERYEGQWSEWSQPVRFSSPQQPGLLIPPWGWPYSTLIAAPIFLLLTGLTYLLFKLSHRVKRTFYQNVPSPAVFFQPLYTVHNGDFQTWTGARRAGLPLTQDCISPQEALESSVREAITLLISGPARPWQSSSLDEAEGTDPGLPGPLSSEDVLLTGHVELAELPSAYLPQEVWALTRPTMLAPADSEGGSDYCALGCYGRCAPSALPQSPGPAPAPAPAPARDLSCDQWGLASQQGGCWSQSEAGHLVPSHPEQVRDSVPKVLEP